MKTEWISVADALPARFEHVIVLFEPGGFFRKRLAFGYLMDGEWHPSAARKFPVTHWTKLPNAPDGSGLGMGI